MHSNSVLGNRVTLDSRFLAWAAVGAAWVPPIVAGLAWSDYSAIRDFISELGAVGAPHATPVGVTFGVAGVLFIVTCVALARALPALRIAMALTAAVGASYVMAAFVPCDAGCPAEGSATQALHNGLGALGYVVGGLGLIRAARPLRAAGHVTLAGLGQVAGTVAILGLMAMGSPELADVRGLIQRVVELGLFAWLLALAHINRSPDRAIG